MFTKDRHGITKVPDESHPLLLVVIDAEAEFDWNRPFSRQNTRVDSITQQYRAQNIFEKYGITPIYVIDFAIATDEKAIEILRRLLEDGCCEIGSHLNPWITPPHDETVSARNSYPGNLAAELERKKLQCLTDAIAESMGIRPTAYKAGRYGLGPNTAGILEDLDYRMDLSVMPFTNFAVHGGPNFNGFDFRPFWFGKREKLLEVPVTCGFSGVLAKRGPDLFPMLANGAGMRIRLPGVCARLGLLERIRLTPEGVDHAAHRRLTESLLAQGCRVFSFTYHSPSLAPGNTPYVRDCRELDEFLERMDRYFDYFINQLGGRPVTATQLHGLLSSGE